MTSPHKSASSDPMTSPYKSASSDPMTSPYKSASSDPSASPYKSAPSDPSASPHKPASSDPMTSPNKSASSHPPASPNKSASSDPSASPYKSASSHPVASVTAPPAPLHLLDPAVQLLTKTQELLVELVLVRHLHVVAPVAGGYGPPVAAVAVVAVVDPSLARVVVSPSPVDVPAPPVVSPATVEANEEEIVRFILGLVKFCSCCIN